MTPQPTPRATRVTMTPEKAAKFLESNTANRNLRTRIVDSYSRDILAGRWTLNGEAIKIATDGTVLDGQHRLHAVVRAGLPIETFVVTGLEPVTQDTMDTGARRQAADQLHLAGISNASTVASASRFALLLEQSAGRDSRHAAITFTHGEVRTFVDENPLIIDAATRATHFGKSLPIARSVVTVAYWKFAALSREDAEEFFSSIAEMRTEGKGDPRLALSRRLAQATQAGVRLSQVEQYTYVVQAWNAWRSGAARTRVQKLGPSTSIPKPL